jgi:hypothetical protein
LVSTSLCAITITYYGQVTQSGVPLESYNYNPVTYDYEDPGVAPLVQLWKVNPTGADVLVSETTVGAGQFLQPVDGLWQKDAVFTAGLSDKIYVKAYAGPTDEYLSITSDYQKIKNISGAYPPDFFYDFGVLDIPIPEPSIILLGVVLLLKSKP